jgi:hypothetical protein
MDGGIGTGMGRRGDGETGRRGEKAKVKLLLSLFAALAAVEFSRGF